MKKLLSILATLAFTASLSSTVVACGSGSSSDKSKLKDSIDWGNNGQELIHLADGTTVRVGDLLKSQSSNINSYLLNDINELVANKYAEDYADQTLNGDTNLGLINLNRTYNLQNPNSSSNNNAYANEIDNFGMIYTAASLYRNYIQSLVSRQPLDQVNIRKDNLNPIYYGNKSDLKGKYSLWFKNKDGKFVRWTTVSETNLIPTDDKYKDFVNMNYLPTPDVLSTNEFYLVDGAIDHTGYSGSKITSDDISKLTADSLPGTAVASNLTGQQALMLRFQSTIQGTSTSTMQDALVMEYAKNNLYKLQSKPVTIGTDYENASNKSLYIDTSSTIATDIQSWPSSRNDLVTSKYKMVWTFSVPTDKNDDIAKVINTLSSKRPNKKLDKVGTDYSLISNDTDITALMKALTDKSTNQNNNGTDPYWGFSGYQGIMVDGKLADGGTLSMNDDAAKKVANVEGLGVLINGYDPMGNAKYNFDSPTIKNKNYDYEIVMPIYLMDLLRSGTAPVAPADAPVAPTATTLNGIVRNQWVELNPQVKDAGWSSSDKFTGPDFAKVGDPLPTKTSLLKDDKSGKTYIFIPDSETSDPTVTVKDKTITITPAALTNDKDYSGYGVKGIYSYTGDDEKGWQYNGQEINYAIRLGTDRNSPDNIERAWKSGDFKDEAINSIANLTNDKKTDIVNTLFAFAAHTDSNLQEETKNNIYRNYISLDDIYYKGLYDELSKYLKEDDSTDDSD